MPVMHHNSVDSSIAADSGAPDAPELGARFFTQRVSHWTGCWRCSSSCGTLTCACIRMTRTTKDDEGATAMRVFESDAKMTPSGILPASVLNRRRRTVLSEHLAGAKCNVASTAHSGQANVLARRHRQWAGQRSS